LLIGHSEESFGGGRITELQWRFLDLKAAVDPLLEELTAQRKCTRSKI